jgi:DNA-binding GntR family transcriptional regulator
MEVHPAATRTQAARCYQALRDRIVLGALAPLEKLKIADLAEEFEVSPGAVREALSRLTTENLVSAVDQRGFRVAPVSLDDLDDLTRTRLQIEELALREAMARGDAAWEASLRAAYAAMQAHPPRPADRLAAELHAGFHAALVAGCGSPTLLRIRAQLYDLSERYRALASVRAAKPRSVADEHATIFRAVLARDAETAVAALSAHISLTTALVRATVTSQGR